jgi:hypothetical protein
LSRTHGARVVKRGGTVAWLCALFVPDASASRTARAAQRALRLLRGARDAVGVVVDGWLAAGSFGSASGPVALRDQRAPEDPVPFFPGTTVVADGEVRHEVALRPRSSCLLRAVSSAVVRGRLSVVASESGEVRVRNVGRSQAALRAAGSSRTLTLRPGALAELG